MSWGYQVSGFINFLSFLSLIQKFETYECVDGANELKIERPVSVQTSENIERVCSAIKEASSTSIPWLSKQVGISRSSVHIIVKEELNLKP